MSSDRLSSENLHASTVARDGRAVVIAGVSGSGKSDLALRLIDQGFSLVSDDRTLVRRDHGKLVASAPLTIRGKIEIRGIGIVELPSIDDVPVALAVDLSSQLERLPEEGQERTILGIPVPLVRVDAMTASAAAKVAIALETLGTKF